MQFIECRCSQVTGIATSNISIAQPNIIGVTSNTNASTGSIGEYIFSQVLNASAVSLTNSTPANVTSITLSAGNWDVGGNVFFNVTSGSSSAQSGWINTVSATVPDPSLLCNIQVSGTLGNCGFVVPSQIIKVPTSTTTTVYLGAESVFTGGVTVSGYLWARRRY